MSLHLVSLFVLLLVGLGLWHRRMPARHMRFMSVAFALDVALVLYIEGTRHAVETVVTTPRPGDLVALDDGDDRVRVWME